jgi:hypothetical protein
MSGWGDDCPPLPKDDQQLREMAWQELLLKWRLEARAARLELVRRGLQRRADMRSWQQCDRDDDDLNSPHGGW